MMWSAPATESILATSLADIGARLCVCVEGGCVWGCGVCVCVWRVDVCVCVEGGCVCVCGVCVCV